VSYVTGRWHRYAKSGFRQNPFEGSGVQLSLLLAA
jgi:TetR/AcrR family transcriptional regulator